MAWHLTNALFIFSFLSVTQHYNLDGVLLQGRILTMSPLQGTHSYIASLYLNLRAALCIAPQASSSSALATEYVTDCCRYCWAITGPHWRERQSLLSTNVNIVICHREAAGDLRNSVFELSSEEKTQGLQQQYILSYVNHTQWDLYSSFPT